MNNSKVQKNIQTKVYKEEKSVVEQKGLVLYDASDFVESTALTTPESVRLSNLEQINYIRFSEEFPNKDYFLSKQNLLIKPIKKGKKYKRLLTDKLVSDEQMRKIITKPYIDTFSNLTNLVKLNPNGCFKSEEELFAEYQQSLVKNQEVFEELVDTTVRQTNEITNVVISHDLFERALPQELLSQNVRKTLILVDTDAVMNTSIYNKLVRSLKANDIEYVTYGNIQPKLNRVLLENVIAFALKHKVDSVIALGSWSLIDFSKILITKLGSPSYVRLNSAHSSKYYSSSSYLVYSIPTVVCMDEKVNSCSLFINNKSKNPKIAYADTISLLTAADNSDCCFFYPDFLLDLNKDKLMQVLIESYFRSIFNFFDFEIGEKEQDLIVGDIKLFYEYAKSVQKGYKLNIQDTDRIARSIVRTVDGTTFIKKTQQWKWFSLESALSGKINSKKIEGLALFGPNYIDQESKFSKEFKVRGELLAQKLYGYESVDGLIYEMFKFNEDFHLPKALFDVKELEKITPDLLASLKRKGSYFLISYKNTKAILKQIPMYS